MLFYPGQVRPGLNICDPVRIFQIPLNSFADSRFKGFGWFPAQLTLNLARIDGIAAVVSRPVGNESDQTPVGAATSAASAHPGARR